MDFPIKPTPPDFQKIITEEQERVHDYSYVQSKRKRQHLEQLNSTVSSYVYNRTLADSFLRTVKARMYEAKEQYKKELEQYINAQEKCVAEATEKIDRQKSAIDAARQDFDTARTFYESFQQLAKEKFQLVRELTKKAFTNNTGGDEEND